MKKRIIITTLVICSVFSACSTSNNNSAVMAGGEPENTTAATIHTQAETTVTTTPAVTTITTKAPDVQTEITATQETNEGDEVDNKWALFLVNQTHPLPATFTVKTRTVEGKYVMDERAAGYAIKMIKAAKSDGVTLRVCSAYRSISYQQKLLNQEVADFKKRYKLNDADAYKKAITSVAVPGQSEHNAGVALDILSNDYLKVDDGFDKTKAFKWLSAHAQEYGFIMRYAKGKEDITGIMYEPWHYRFVGINQAKKIKASGLCLEEYMQQ